MGAPIQGGYARDFKDRVNRTIETFAIEGLQDAKLSASASEAITEESVRNIREGLIRLASRIDEPPHGISDFRVEHGIIQGMGAEEYRKAMQHPSFPEAVNRVFERIGFSQGD